MTAAWCVLAVAGLLHAGPAQGVGPTAPPECGCLTVDQAIAGIDALPVSTWRGLDRPGLERHWPEDTTRPCQANLREGTQSPEEVVDDIARCCEACGVCTLAFFDDGQRGSGLESMAMWVCPRDRQPVDEALARLTAAARPPATAVRSTDAWESGTTDEYVWSANGELFNLHALGTDVESGWMGLLQIGRCRAESVIETWDLGADRVVRVTSADVMEQDGQRELWFGFLSECPRSGDCGDAELEAIWPRLSARADREKVGSIFVEVGTCLGIAVLHKLERTSDGRWKNPGGGWTPK